MQWLIEWLLPVRVAVSSEKVACNLLTVQHPTSVFKASRLPPHCKFYTNRVSRVHGQKEIIPSKFVTRILLKMHYSVI